ncbi:MAG: hypothetical protein EOP07_03960 [Proteobacteria bacterium]|nr:MAG: hypothetical protein EOP07_03960 [Pseudomonadota bacterium]
MKKQTLYSLISFNLLITSCSVEPSKEERAEDKEALDGMTLGSEAEAPLVDEGAKTPLPDLTLTSVVHSYYTITVRDRATNLPIPGVKLKTTNRIEFTSDVNGKIAFYEPGLMATRVWFSVSHPGYAAQPDGIGIAGATLSISEGGSGDVLLDKTSNATVAADNYQTRLLAAGVPGPNESHAIRVIDKVSRRGVPLVFLVDEKGVTRLTDSQGYLAYHHLDEMNKSHTFTITSHGYSSSSKTLTATQGATTEIELERRMIAERLYRTTGQGIYRESYLLGLTMPTKNPNVNGLVMGQDTVDSTLYKGKIFWTWQDTDRVGYVFGSFANTAATSALPANGGLNPDLGVDRDYYVGNDGFAKPIAPDFAPTSALTWLGDLVAIPDASGEERLYGRFAKVKGDGSFVRGGWALFDDAATKFRDLNLAENDPVLNLPAAPLRFNTPTGDKLYFGLRRVAATAESLFDGTQHESFTAYKAGTKNLETDADGRPVFSWKKGTEVASEADLTALGVSSDYQLNDGHKFKGLNGEGLGISGSQLNKVWNPYRQKFVGTIQQALGSPSTFGEMWFAEGDTPMGPWNYAVKVVSHDNYTSYNVKQDGLLMQNNGRKIYIEGTYTASFTQNATPTVRYNYNQVIYRLDLADQKLRLPVAVYEMESGAKRDYAVKGDIHLGTAPLAARFFAMDRPTTGMIGLGWVGALLPVPRLVNSSLCQKGI